MTNYCEDCGSKSYGGHCTWCHEETYIAEQNYQNDEPISFSDEFNEKLEQQAEEAKEILKNQKTIKEVDEELNQEEQ